MALHMSAISYALGPVVWCPWRLAWESGEVIVHSPTLFIYSYWKLEAFSWAWPLSSEGKTQFPLRCYLKQGNCIHILWANVEFSTHAHFNVSVPERKNEGVTQLAFPGFGMGESCVCLSPDLRKFICSEKFIVLYPSNNYSFLIWERVFWEAKVLSQWFTSLSLRGLSEPLDRVQCELHHFTLQMRPIWDIKEWTFSKV